MCGHGSQRPQRSNSQVGPIDPVIGSPGDWNESLDNPNDLGEEKT